MKLWLSDTPSNFRNHGKIKKIPLPCMRITANLIHFLIWCKFDTFSVLIWYISYTPSNFKNHGKIKRETTALHDNNCRFDTCSIKLVFIEFYYFSFFWNKTYIWKKKTIPIFITLKTKADRYQPSEYYFITRNIKSTLSQKILLFT